MSANTIIAELYVSMLGRAPDAEGLAYWAEQYENGLMQLSDIAENWAISQAEFLELYPEGKVEDFVHAIYRNLLGREPDEAGADYWSEQLSNGALARDTFVLDILDALHNNPDSADAQIAQNRTEIGLLISEASPADPNLYTSAIQAVTANPVTADIARQLIDLVVQQPDSASAVNEVLASMPQLNNAAHAADVLPQLAEVVTQIVNHVHEGAELSTDTLNALNATVTATAADANFVNNAAELAERLVQEPEAVNEEAVKVVEEATRPEPEPEPTPAPAPTPTPEPEPTPTPVPEDSDSPNPSNPSGPDNPEDNDEITPTFSVTEIAEGVYEVGSLNGDVVLSRNGNVYTLTPTKGEALRIPVENLKALAVNATNEENKMFSLISTAETLDEIDLQGNGIIQINGYDPENDLSSISETLQIYAIISSDLDLSESAIPTHLKGVMRIEENAQLTLNSAQASQLDINLKSYANTINGRLLVRESEGGYEINISANDGFHEITGGNGDDVIRVNGSAEWFINGYYGNDTIILDNNGGYTYISPDFDADTIYLSESTDIIRFFTTSIFNAEIELYRDDFDDNGESTITINGEDFTIHLKDDNRVEFEMPWQISPYIMFGFPSFLDDETSVQFSVSFDRKFTLESQGTSVTASLIDASGGILEDSDSTFENHDVIFLFDTENDKLDVRTNQIFKGEVHLQNETILKFDNGIVSWTESENLEALKNNREADDPFETTSLPLEEETSSTSSPFDLETIFSAIAEAMEGSISAAAFYDGFDTYVYRGSGLGQIEITDIFVKLVDIEVNDLGSILM